MSAFCLRVLFACCGLLSRSYLIIVISLTMARDYHISYNILQNFWKGNHLILNWGSGKYNDILILDTGRDTCR